MDFLSIACIKRGINKKTVQTPFLLPAFQKDVCVAMTLRYLGYFLHVSRRVSLQHLQSKGSQVEGTVSFAWVPGESPFTRIDRTNQ